MSNPTPNITINVDVTNPGQFFACCGLLELADRLWPGAEGWFSNDRSQFYIECKGSLAQLLDAARSIKYATTSDDNENDDKDDGDDDENSDVQPLVIISPIQIRLDWWTDKSIKTWAGSMKVNLIAAAVSGAIDPQQSDPLNQAQSVFDPPGQPIAGTKKTKTPKKREPFYFDCRRAMNSHSLDVGFSANDLKIKTLAYPVVEFFCLVGLQRCRPLSTSRHRVLDYSTWSWRCPVNLLSAACTGYIPDNSAMRLRFENGFRSGRKKHKAFRTAIPLSQGV